MVVRKVKRHGGKGTLYSRKEKRFNNTEVGCCANEKRVELVICMRERDGDEGSSGSVPYVFWRTYGTQVRNTRNVVIPVIGHTSRTWSDVVLYRLQPLRSPLPSHSAYRCNVRPALG